MRRLYRVECFVRGAWVPLSDSWHASRHDAGLERARYQTAKQHKGYLTKINKIEITKEIVVMPSMDEVCKPQQKRHAVDQLLMPPPNAKAKASPKVATPKAEASAGSSGGKGNGYSAGSSAGSSGGSSGGHTKG